MIAPITKIDMTPLVGLALILVIVFVVASPGFMLRLDDGISLPAAETAEVKPTRNLTVSLGYDSELSVNASRVVPADLVKELQHRLAGNDRQLVVIRADKNVRHSQILQLLAQLKKAGAVNVALATEAATPVKL